MRLTASRLLVLLCTSFDKRGRAFRFWPDTTGGSWRRLTIEPRGYAWEGEPTRPADPGNWDGVTDYETHRDAYWACHDHARFWPPLAGKCVREALKLGWIARDSAGMLAVTPVGLAEALRIQLWIYTRSDYRRCRFPGDPRPLLTRRRRLSRTSPPPYVEPLELSEPPPRRTRPPGWSARKRRQAVERKRRPPEIEL